MVRSWLKDHPVKDVKRPIREFVPYSVLENDYVTLCVAYRYRIHSGHIL